LRAHGLIHKLAKHRRYRITLRGQILMTTALTFRKSDAALLTCKAA
jgi:hypothetical protein